MAQEKIIAVTGMSTHYGATGDSVAVAKDLGSVAEWFKALVLKTSVGGTPP